MERIKRLVRNPTKPNLSLPYLGQILVLATLYFFTAKIGLSLAGASSQVSVVWPPTGLSLAAIFLLGYRVWPGLALGAFLANITTHPSIMAATGIAAGNTLEALAGAWLLHRVVGFNPTLARLKDALGLIGLGALLSTTISATLGVASLCLFTGESWTSYPTLWSLWWWGNGMGNLVVAPLLFTWAIRLQSPWTRREILEVGALLVPLTIIGLFLFNPDWALANLFRPAVLVFPTTVYAALRLGPTGASLTTFVICALAILKEVTGGADGSPEAMESRLFELQIFLGTSAIVGLVLAATSTERRNIESALRISEERVRYTLDAANVGTWEWDMETGDVHWSERLEAIHMLPPGSFAGTFEDFLKDIHPDYKESVIQGIVRAVEEDTVYHEEYRLIAPGGELLWMEAKGRAIYGPGRKPIRMVGICMDTTERKNLELRLHELTDYLEVKVRERTAVAEKRAAQLQSMAAQLSEVETRERKRLARILHDGLQQLLVGAKFSVSRMRKHAATPEVVLETSEQLDEILNECIQASRSLSQELTPPGLHDRNFAVALKWLAREMKERHGLHVELKADNAAAGISENKRTFLYQAIRELLFNIVKHAQVDQATVHLAISPDEIRVEISDNGTGFEVDRLDASEMGGLGLLSVRERIAQMGGRVDIQSKPGAGSRFLIAVPCDKNLDDCPEDDSHIAPFTTKSAPIVEIPGKDSIRVLLVDDHPLKREGLAMLLCEDSEFLIVGEVPHGTEIFEVAAAARPDVIILDVTTPNVDGVGVVHKIRQAHPDTRIVAISLFDEESGEASRLMEAGVAFCLSRRGSSEALFEAIRRSRGNRPGGNSSGSDGHPGNGAYTTL